jgi:hypothetical protein
MLAHNGGGLLAGTHTRLAHRVDRGKDLVVTTHLIIDWRHD